MITLSYHGDPTSFEPFPAPEHNAFNGQALVVVRTLADRPGKIRVSAQSGALQGASVTLQSLAAAR
jgi:beta-galactosidase